MPTSPYAHWLRAAVKHAAVIDEEEDSGVIHDIGRSLLAGVDPSGARITRMAAEEQVRKADAARHRGLGALAVGGGVVGGAILVPSVMSALYGGIMGLQQGAGVRGKAVGAVTGAASGVWGRLSGIGKGSLGKSLVRQAEEAGTAIPLTDSGRAALRWMADRAPVSSMAGHAVPNFATMTHLTPEQAAILKGPAQGAMGALITQTSVGGILGGTAAFSHYRRGKKMGDEYYEALMTPVPQDPR